MDQTIRTRSARLDRRTRVNRREFVALASGIFVPGAFAATKLGIGCPAFVGSTKKSAPALSCSAWTGQEMMTHNDFSTLDGTTTISQKVKGISASDVTVCKMQVVISSLSTGSVQFAIFSTFNAGGTNYSGSSNAVAVSGASATYDVTWPSNFTLPASTDFFITHIKGTLTGSVQWRENDGIFLYQDNTYTIYDPSTSYAGQQTFKLFTLQ